jgi:hypothetical protein
MKEKERRKLSRRDRGGLKQFLHYLVYLNQKWFDPYDFYN